MIERQLDRQKWCYQETCCSKGAGKKRISRIVTTHASTIGVRQTSKNGDFVAKRLQRLERFGELIVFPFALGETTANWLVHHPLGKPYAKSKVNRTEPLWLLLNLRIGGRSM